MIGVGIAGFWSALIATGGMDFQRTGIVESVFHLVSEGILATTCIVTGLGLLRRTARSARWYFLAAGLLISSVSAAAVFYTVDPIEADPAMVTLFAIIAALAAALLGASARGMVGPAPGGVRRAALLFSGGLLIYANLNVCGTLLGSSSYNVAQVTVLIAGSAILGAALLTLVLRGAEADESSQM